ncbi:MAG: hypothetical protein ABII21_03965 [bacterium]
MKNRFQIPDSRFQSLLASSIWYLTSAPKALAADFKFEYQKYNDAIGLKGNANIGSIVSTLLPIILQVAGLILFGMLVMGGFTMLAGAADKESQEKGKGMVTSALVGFLIIFLAYWIAQLLQIIFKVNILS